MNALDTAQEVGEALARNRLRTFLTAMSVAWGTFMLVALLGMGRGLENNVAWMFRDDAVNSIWIRPGQTSIPFAGFPMGRQIQFTNADYRMLREGVPGVEKLTGRFYVWGEGSIRRGDRVSSFDIRSCHPDHRYLEKTLVVAGRFLNSGDLREKRKVAVIGKAVAEFLFPNRDPLVAPLSQDILIGGLAYQVVGVFEDVGGEGELRKVYIPISTAQAAYQGGQRVDQLMFTVSEGMTYEQSEAIVADVRRKFAKRHRFAEDDPRALRISNNLEEFAKIQRIFRWLGGFIWLVGLGTVAAGIVGVSNIMLIGVRERTREIGLRKALGAPPRSIIAMILWEAVFLTGASGYAGLIAGVGLIEAMRRILPENDYIRDPEVELAAALGALGMLVLSGGVAGYIPARRAADVPPIEALRSD